MTSSGQAAVKRQTEIRNKGDKMNRFGVTNSPWELAQEAEMRHRRNFGYSQGVLDQAKRKWNLLLQQIPSEVLDNYQTKNILEEGGAGTSIFLSLKGCKNVAVDPLYADLLDLYPSLKECEEYNEVTFLSWAIEDTDLHEGTFDLIFMINVLDHMGNLNTVSSKVYSLLAPLGYLIVLVDCYSNTLIRDVSIRLEFDPTHPHRLTMDDVLKLHRMYDLVYSDQSIWRSFDVHAINTGKEGKFKALFKSLSYMDSSGTLKLAVAVRKDRKAIFSYFKRVLWLLCSLLLICYAKVLRREEPIYPFKKKRLFIFRKGTKT